MDYCARANIGVPGYGRVTPGEILDEKCKEMLGEEALNDLVQRGALRLMTDAKPVPERGQEDAEPPEETAAAVTSSVSASAATFPKGEGFEERCH